jgi:hypothetical protein
MNESPIRRKRISFDAATWHALHQLSLDSMRSLQELADEAFRDLLKKQPPPGDVERRIASERPHATGQRSSPSTGCTPVDLRELAAPIHKCLWMPQPTRRTTVMIKQTPPCRLTRNLHFDFPMREDSPPDARARTKRPPV